MEDLAPKPGDLDPIETASRDEIGALQLQRMRWSLHHAYDNVPFYRAKFDAAGVHPDDLHSLSDLAQKSSTVSCIDKQWRVGSSNGWLPTKETQADM